MVPRFEVSEVAFSDAASIDLSNPTPLDAGGTYASVWRAGRYDEYAIKSFRDVSEDVARAEYELLVRLNEVGCSHVPRVYCLGTLVNVRGVRHHAIVEQYVEGETLAQVLDEGKLSKDARANKLSERQALLVALEVAKALDAIAGCGIAHRDLSPNNVMLTTECIEAELRGGAEVYLVDFGQSTLTDRQTVTPGPPRLATIPYGAPEMFGGEHYDDRNKPWCDIWSLGALMCRMVAGEYWPEEVCYLDNRNHVWTREDLKTVAHAKRDPIDLVARMREARVAPGPVALGLADVVRKCTSYEPADRPSPSEVVMYLESILREPGGIDPSPVTPIYGEANHHRSVEKPEEDSTRAQPRHLKNVEQTHPGQPKKAKRRSASNRQSKSETRTSAPPRKPESETRISAPARKPKNKMITSTFGILGHVFIPAVLLILIVAMTYIAYYMFSKGYLGYWPIIPIIISIIVFIIAESYERVDVPKLLGGTFVLAVLLLLLVAMRYVVHYLSSKGLLQYWPIIPFLLLIVEFIITGLKDVSLGQSRSETRTSVSDRQSKNEMTDVTFGILGEVFIPAVLLILIAAMTYVAYYMFSENHLEYLPIIPIIISIIVFIIVESNELMDASESLGCALALAILLLLIIAICYVIYYIVAKGFLQSWPIIPFLLFILVFMLYGLDS